MFEISIRFSELDVMWIFPIRKFHFKVAHWNIGGFFKVKDGLKTESWCLTNIFCHNTHIFLTFHIIYIHKNFIDPIDPRITSGVTMFWQTLIFLWFEVGYCLKLAGCNIIRQEDSLLDAVYLCDTKEVLMTLVTPAWPWTMAQIWQF